MSRVLVLGGGVAGTAAALAASAAGARVSVVFGRPGASVLASGALDGAPLDADDAALLAKLGGYVVGEGPACVLSPDGPVRWAQGRDEALLDVARLEPGPLVVADVEHPSWDATSVARAWRESDHLRGRAVEPLPMPILRQADEPWLPDADLAERHDDPDRFAWLVGRIEEALASQSTRPAGLVLPSWLGLRTGAARVLSARLGLPCGEALARPGGPAGLRFEERRTRALREANVEVLADEAASVLAGDAVMVELVSGRVLEAETCVLATGGLLGALVYNPGEAQPAGEFPEGARVPFSLRYAAPVSIGAFGRPLGAPGSLFGVEPEHLLTGGKADLRRVGILGEGTGARVRGAAHLFVAGDAQADRPRTWLEAFAAGARAGRAAAAQAPAARTNVSEPAGLGP